MSAQETVALQDALTCVLMASITSNPRTEFAFGPALFSPVNVDVSSSRIEPSHPCRQQQQHQRNTNVTTYSVAQQSTAKADDQLHLDLVAQSGEEAYIDETVMEEKAKNGGAHSLLRLHSRCHP
jgi:hypothetical protein